MSIDPIAAASIAAAQQPVLTQVDPANIAATNAVNPAMSVANGAEGLAAQETASFADILMSRVSEVQDKVTHANDMVRQFAVDDSIPVHQVTFALEEARLSFELMLQVRTRMVEGYREIMNMQM